MSFSAWGLCSGIQGKPRSEDQALGASCMLGPCTVCHHLGLFLINNVCVQGMNKVRQGGWEGGRELIACVLRDWQKGWKKRERKRERMSSLFFRHIWHQSWWSCKCVCTWWHLPFCFSLHLLLSVRQNNDLFSFLLSSWLLYEHFVQKCLHICNRNDHRKIFKQTECRESNIERWRQENLSLELQVVHFFH